MKKDRKELKLASTDFNWKVRQTEMLHNEDTPTSTILTPPPFHPTHTMPNILSQTISMTPIIEKKKQIQP